MTEQSIKIVRIPIKAPTLWPNTDSNSYLIGNEKETLLIDAGYDMAETKIAIENTIQQHQMAPPHSVVLTHYHQDHAPGVRQLNHILTKAYCHVKEFNEIKTAISPIQEIEQLVDGTILKVAERDIQILHSPGHTAGHVSLYIPSEKVLISGDAIVSEGTTWIGPPDGDMNDFLQTLQRFKTLDIEKIGPGHGEWVYQPYDKIDFVIHRRLHREKQIKDLLKGRKALTLDDLTKLIYENKIDSSVFEVAKRTIEAHLIKLKQEGVVKKHHDHYSL
ncbi:Glyoxylase, beta-lactamase superfamily II [Salinibacillus kushneri]|uniref:Glyoxylase, beta-lactamase superfamily II n=1 Tax=Salinibacillus kushneri TaxID=237682 RepID=A0A1I0DWT3_9BACI|nr:MBL fold metallo-hydrolase [Salinibacillus kushneri]SET37121.1 Glyoxylase, beta-lactamase superfamily II [Salinibacillus kushneri]